jgi:DNA-directed RNA polymerase specialized sigma24 family protein
LVKREGDGGTDGRSDADLLARVDSDPDAFALFYERHVNAVFGYLAQLTGNHDVALELTTEVFALALRRSSRFKRRRSDARTWLLAIAEETLALSYRAGAIKDTARRKLGVPVEPCTKEDWDAVAARIRTAADGPLRRVASIGGATSLKGALTRRISRGTP